MPFARTLAMSCKLREIGQGPGKKAHLAGEGAQRVETR